MNIPAYNTGFYHLIDFSLNLLDILDDFDYSYPFVLSVYHRIDYFDDLSPIERYYLLVSLYYRYERFT